MTTYETLCGLLQGLMEGVTYPVSNLANAAALLYRHLDRINWAGCYLVRDGVLVLGPFQGAPACVRIPFAKGVCGKAAREDRTVVVADVGKFPGHIACDAASKSEIVVPLHAAGRLFGVLDLDSPVLDRFQDADKEGLERFARVLEEGLVGV